MTQQDKATQDFFKYEESLEKQKHMIEDALKGEKQREAQQLLDDFAKAALTGLITNEQNFEYLREKTAELLARDAYDIATAMMQERERRMKG